jgi:hypothetical protein
MDRSRPEYELHWWDALGMPPNEFRGPFAGGVPTLTHEAPHMRSRAVFDTSQPGRYRLRMDVSVDGRDWQAFLDGEYTRA